MTSVDIGGLTQFISHSVSPPLFGNSSASCGAAGTAIASCSQTTSTTIDGAQVSTTVSGTAEAQYDMLSITSQVTTSPVYGFTGADSNVFSLLENYLNNQDTASFSEGLLVQAPGYTDGFLQFTGFFSDRATDHFGGEASAVAVINGQSYNLADDQEIDIPVEFGVPFMLNASLELQGQDGTEVVGAGTDYAELDFSQSTVLDESGNPIAGATITPVPEASSWWLLLTAAAFVVPSIRRRFSARP